MFMHVTVNASALEESMEISRSMLFDENKVFVVVDSVLVEKKINIEHSSKRTAVISGLENGERILTKIPPGAYAGMAVSVYQNREEK